MQEPSLPGLMSDAFRSQMNNVYTAMPCIVVAIPDNLTDMRVDVQPSLNKKYKDGRIEEQPVIFNVPLQMPGSSTTLISFPVHMGDTVLCVFSSRGLDAFKAGNGYPSTPTDFRKFDKRDAMAIPGLFPFSRSVNNPAVRKWAHNTQDLVVSHNISSGTEVEIRLDTSGNLTINTDQDVTVNANNATVNAQSSVAVSAPSMDVNVANTSWNGNINHSGTLSNSGTIVSNGVTVSGHIHASSPPPTPGT